MSQVTYDVLAALAVLSVPAAVILFSVVRTQVKELELLRKQVAHLKKTHQQFAPPNAEDHTIEQEALPFDGTQTDQLEAEPPRKVGYDPNAASVFEKLKLRR
jgi:hypothetical protein